LHDYPPSDEITSSSYIGLVSGAISITRSFFARGSVKGVLLNDPLDDQKKFLKLEVGYDSNSWFRVSVGYERIESDLESLYNDREYIGQGAFLRFSGKI
jgi:hypothetical protein